MRVIASLIFLASVVRGEEAAALTESQRLDLTSFFARIGSAFDTLKFYGNEVSLRFPEASYLRTFSVPQINSENFKQYSISFYSAPDNSRTFLRGYFMSLPEESDDVSATPCDKKRNQASPVTKKSFIRGSNVLDASDSSSTSSDSSDASSSESSASSSYSSYSSSSGSSSGSYSYGYYSSYSSTSSGSSSSSSTSTDSSSSDGSGSDASSVDASESTGDSSSAASSSIAAGDQTSSGDSEGAIADPAESSSPVAAPGSSSSMSSLSDLHHIHHARPAPKEHVSGNWRVNPQLVSEAAAPAAVSLRRRHEKLSEQKDSQQAETEDSLWSKGDGEKRATHAALTPEQEPALHVTGGRLPVQSMNMLNMHDLRA